MDAKRMGPIKRIRKGICVWALYTPIFLQVDWDTWEAMYN